MGAARLQRALYQRLYIAQLHAGSRFPDAPCADHGARLRAVVKWWKARLPLPVVGPSLPRLPENAGWRQENDALAEYFAPASFSFDDYEWARRGIEAPLEVLAEAIGRKWVRCPPVGASRKQARRWWRSIAKNGGLLRAKGAAAAARRQGKLARALHSQLCEALWPLLHRAPSAAGESLVLRPAERQGVVEWDVSARCAFTGTSVLEDRGLQKLVLTVGHAAGCLADCVTGGDGGEVWADAEEGEARMLICGRREYLDVVAGALELVTHVDALVRVPERASCYSGLLGIGRNTVVGRRAHLRAADVASASYDRVRATQARTLRSLAAVREQMDAER